MDPLVTSSLDWTVQTVVSQVARGGIAASPGMLYAAPWGRDEAVCLVESAIAGIPLGQVTALGLRGPALLVDGARRLSALCLFLGVVPPWPHGGRPGFSLSGARMFPGIEGCTADSLPDRLRVALDNAALRLVRVGPASWMTADVLRDRVHGGG